MPAAGEGKQLKRRKATTGDIRKGAARHLFHRPKPCPKNNQHPHVYDHTHSDRCRVCGMAMLDAIEAANETLIRRSDNLRRTHATAAIKTDATAEARGPKR